MNAKTRVVSDWFNFIFRSVYIFFFVMCGWQAVEKSPFLETLSQKGLEVIYLTEAVDEMTVQSITEYEDKR